MGDAMDALEMLLGPDGMDHGRLSEAEQQNNGISSHAYTDHDRRVLRHWEGAAQPAKRLCKVLQDDNDAYTQLLFEYRVAIQDTSAPTIPIFADISRMDRTKDLCNRGDKTLLAKKSDVDVLPDVIKNYTKVEPMEPCVERYRELYSKDLSERLGLENDFLEPSLTNSVLLNPMFGLEKRVVSSGLMTHRQYSRARSSE